MSYKFLDHTADIGIEVKSSDLKEAIVESIYGLLELIFGKSFIDLNSEIGFEELEITSNDLESVTVDTLNEILYLIDTQKIIPLKLEIIELSNNYLKIKYKPMKFNLLELPMHIYVKAVTYHQLEISKKDNQTIIIFFLDI